MADILTSKIQVPSLPDDTLILKDAEARNDLSTALATATGNPLNFSTRSAQKAKETVISLEPIQDLHGYDHPWSAGGGKNLIPMTVDGIKAANTSGTWNGNVYTHKGISYTIQTDDGNNIVGIVVNGTCESSESLLVLYDWSTTILEDLTSYVLNGCAANGSVQTYNIYVNNVSTASGSVNDYVKDYGTGVAFTTKENHRTVCRISVRPNITFNNLLFKPMICLATETDPTFAPYSNYCPIDGRTETSLMGTNGKESTDPDYIESNNLTIQFGEKVYGGTLDVVSGELTVDRAMVDLGSLEWFTQSSLHANFVSNDLADKILKSDTKIVVWSDSYKSERNVSSVALASQIYANSVGMVKINDTRYSTVTDFVSNMRSSKIIYELATPITYHLTPHQVFLLEGVNTIWTDGTSIKVSYRDGKVATLGDLDDAANNLQEQIDQNETMEDETTQLLYKLGVNNGLLFMEEV